MYIYKVKVDAHLIIAGGCMSVALLGMLIRVYCQQIEYILYYELYIYLST